MPVSLGRKLRRIGIPLKAQRSEEWSVDKESREYRQEAVALIEGAKLRRDMAFSKRKKPSRLHRRSRGRLKISKSVEVSRGKK